jgi:ATP-binding cassette subfamily C (CFTR/MRP) protein 1
MASGVIFSHLMEEYGNLEAEAHADNHLSSKRKVKKDAEAEDSTEEGGPKKNSNIALMQTEERNTGAVTWSVYQKYLGFTGGMIWAPIIVLLLTLTQGAQGVFWFCEPYICWA